MIFSKSQLLKFLKDSHSTAHVGEKKYRPSLIYTGAEGIPINGFKSTSLDFATGSQSPNVKRIFCYANVPVLAF